MSLFVRASSNAAAQAAAERALLYAIDWGEVQSKVGRPMLLYDPDQEAPVYASTIGRNLLRAKEALAEVGARDNFKIGGFGIRPETKDLILIQAAEAGIAISFFNLPAGEVITGTEAGIGDGGFLLFDSPEDFANLQRGNR